MDLVKVDGRDTAVFERFFRVRDDARRAEQEFPAGLGLEEARVLMAGIHSDVRVDGLGLVDGDTWLGIVWLDWWLQENKHLVDVEIAVDPAYRRTGVGSKLLEAVTEAARADGRTLLSGDIICDATTGESPGTAFAAARGFERKHTELHQVIELPLPAERIAELEQPDRGGGAGKKTAQLDGYKLLQWREHTPDEWLEQFADALSAMTADIPHGDREIEVSRWTPERVREVEARRIQQGRFCHTTVAVDEAGRLAAYTQMGGAAKNPDRLYQWDTFVRREHRGRRLGWR